jgi:hypothetical protein
VRLTKLRTDQQLALIRAVEAATAQLTADQRSRLTVLLVPAPGFRVRPTIWTTAATAAAS